VIDARAHERSDKTVAVYDHAIDCAWQDGVSNCDCNKEAVSEQLESETKRNPMSQERFPLTVTDDQKLLLTHLVVHEPENSTLRQKTTNELIPFYATFIAVAPTIAERTPMAMGSWLRHIVNQGYVSIGDIKQLAEVEAALRNVVR
jgi:hypothetical protein